MKAVAYLRISKESRNGNGASPEAQRRAIADELARRGWALVAECSDVASGGSTNGRPGLDEAVRLLESGQAEVLVVAKLDRLSRSLGDFARLMERSRRSGWAIVALDLGVDTTTPTGEAMASMLAVFAQWERRMIGLRTKEALAVKRSQGVRLGRPSGVPDKLRRRIRAMRRRGWTLQRIADQLTAEAIPTAQGGARWWPSTVKALL